MNTKRYSIQLISILKILLATVLVTLVTALGCASNHYDQKPNIQIANHETVTTQKNLSDTTQDESLPHLSVDLENRWVDLDAVINMREGDWIELLACSPGSRTHESILVVWTKPSHIHLALMMLDLQPGAPMKWLYLDDQVTTVMPHGPKIAVEIIFDSEGKQESIPANHWVIDKTTKEFLPDNTWLFTGSMLIEPDKHSDSTYRADIEGSILSLVNFGDDVLAKPTDRTRDNDHAMWSPNTKLIPPVGTPVTIRLRVIKD